MKFATLIRHLRIDEEQLHEGWQRTARPRALYQASVFCAGSLAGAGPQRYIPYFFTKGWGK
jgi:hypothetical protein